MTEKKKRKQWRDEDMIGAMSAVNNKEMTIYKAAASFKVPRKTLDDRLKGCVKHGTKVVSSMVQNLGHLQHLLWIKKKP